MKTKLLRITMMVALLLAAMTMGQAQNVPINLEQGWNWISYPHSEPMSIEEALSGFTPAEGDVIKSQTGTTQYQNGTWTGSLTTLVPGEGYMYRSSDGSSRSFVFGGDANDPSALPNEALDGEFTVDANGTKVRFSPGNLQCRIDPNQESQITVGTGTSTTGYMPYYTYYKYSLCQMIYKAEELHAAGLTAGSITGIAFESYSTNHFLRDNIEIWMAATTLTEAPSTSVSTSGMKKVFFGSVTQQTGWTEILFTSSPFTWDGTSNLMVTVLMNHGSYDSPTPWQCSEPGFTCCNYIFTDNSAYEPSSTTYSMGTSTTRPNTRFNGKGGVTWRFAEHQKDYIGAGNTNISDTYAGWIDLFGWGTSGHPHGAVCYQPWSTSTMSSDYYAYGDASYNLFDCTGEADWGCNPISNGGDKPNQWRTLTNQEWMYMFLSRTTSSGQRYAKAIVDGVNGIILLPDNWQTSYYNLNNTNSGNANYSTNTINASQWNTLEQHGAVFLPAGGCWNTVNYYAIGNNGIYWSATYYNSEKAYHIGFSNTVLDINNASSSRSSRYSVRLVCQTNPRIRTLGMTSVTMNSATANAEVDYTGSATVTERGVCWNTTVAPTVSNSHQAAGSGTGSFTAQLTLSAGTTYYIRAYAKIGTTYRYGNELTFTTSSALTVSTAMVTGITGTFAQCGGTVTGGGQSVTARGVCWSTSSEPTLSNNHTYDGWGEGNFSSMVDNLTAGTTYYVRAYATTAEGTVYGEQRSFTASDVVEVTTSVVTDIAITTATCGGLVDNHGGNAITARGVCWGTTSSPTVSGSHTTDGTGIGYFTSSLTNLTPSTTYYVRAYATTAQGTTYGSQQSFTTLGQVSVTTAAVSYITTNAATCGGTVTGDIAVTARGVCWGTTSSPTVSGSHTTDGTGTGSFTSSLTNLTLSTTYYVRAYATTALGTVYGSQKTFTTTAPPTGAIDGLFSVSATQQVYFSQGNLQYKASTNTWRFATNQYDCIGSNNSNISSTYSGYIDLFGWGTSGYNHGAVCYQPWSTSTTNSDYYAYGSVSYNLYDQTGKADWGYNAISNGGNTTHQWRTLTNDEWMYVLNTRATASGKRYAKARVNNVNGVILLPDNWSSSTYSLSNANTDVASYSSNIISSSQWATLENAGAVFLPAAGTRNGTTCNGAGSGGSYWSASCNGSGAYNMNFANTQLLTNFSYPRFYGWSVRLVRNVE